MKSSFNKLIFSLLLSAFISPVQLLGQNTVLLYEDFESGVLPSGWTSLYNAGGQGWQFGISSYSSTFWGIPAHPDGGLFTAANDDNCNCDSGNDRLITPSMDVSNFDSVMIFFDAYFDGDYTSLAYVGISSNGGSTWTDYVVSWSIQWETYFLVVNAPNLSNDFKVRFVHSDDGDWGSGFALDNVIVFGMGLPCVPSYTFGQDPENLINQIFVNTSYDSLGYDAGVYYTNNTGLPFVNLTEGHDYQLVLGGSGFDLETFSAWIDFNQNYSFDTNEFLGSCNATGGLCAFTFSVPAGLEGAYTMRIMSQEDSLTNITPCGNYSYGETVDYTVTISQSGVVCLSTYALGPDSENHIDAVALNGASATNLGYTVTEYYTDNTSTSLTTLNAGNTYNLTVTGSGSNYETFSAWIDYNGDNSFDSTEKIGDCESVNGSCNISFTVPQTASAGTFRLRVVSQEEVASPTSACAAYLFGEHIDFNIEILGLCEAPTANFTAICDPMVDTAFYITVEITDLGTATTIEITDGAITFESAAGLGTYTVGPFSNNDSVQITLVHDTDTDCNLVSDYLIENCGPACIAPTVFYNAFCFPGEDTTFYIALSITDMGDASGFNVTLDPGGTVLTNVIFGSYTLGPFPNNTFIEVTVEHDGDSTCNVSQTLSHNCAAPPVACPTEFNLTGGGNYCPDTAAGVSLVLDSSQTGIKYLLIRLPEDTAAILEGTGNLLDFGLHGTPGDYGVLATISEVIYTENFGNGTSLPAGWVADPTWTTVSTGVSTGYQGASGSGQLRSTNLDAGSVSFSGRVNTQNHINLEVIWGARRSLTQDAVVLEWSIDSVTWNPVSFTDVAADTLWALINGGVPVSLPPAAEGATDLQLRWTVSAAGTYRIDDLIIKGTPVQQCPTLMNGVLSIGLDNPVAILTNPSSASVCEGSNVTFSVVAEGDSLTYAWQESVDSGANWSALTDSGAYSGTTSAELMISDAGFNLDGNYFRVIVNGLCGGPDTSATTNLTVNPIPFVELTLADSVYCLSEAAVTLSGNPAGGVFSGPGVSGSSFLPAFAGSGTHGLVYTYTDTLGCSNSDTAWVEILPAPAVSFSGLPALVCENDSVIHLTPMPSGGIFSGPGITDSIFDPAASGIGGTFVIFYTYTDENNCVYEVFDSVTVNTLPVVTIAGTGSYCENETDVALNGLPVGGDFSGDGIFNNLFFPDSIGAGFYSINYTYTDPLTGCTNETDITLEVKGVAEVSIDNIAATYCENAAAVTVATTPSSGVLSGPGISGSTFSPETAGSGVHTLFYVFENSNGCESNTSVEVEVFAAPVVEILAVDTPVCDDDLPVNLVGSPAGGTFTGTAVEGNSFDPRTAGVGPNVITYNYVDGNGCSGETSLLINVTVCTSVEELSLESDWSVYPNPFVDRIIVEVYLQSESEISFSLIDMKGSLVEVLKKQSTIGENTFELQFNRQLPEGQYLLHIETAYGFNNILLQKVR